MNAMKILLIDDSATMREITRSVLVQLDDAEVVEARDGEEGLGLAESIGPDLVVVDDLMPGMDGLSFLRAFRKCNGSTPVIVIGSDNGRQHVVEAIKAGASNYLAKPYTPDLLSQRVQETMSAGPMRAASSR